MESLCKLSLWRTSQGQSFIVLVRENGNMIAVYVNSIIQINAEHVRFQELYRIRLQFIGFTLFTAFGSSTTCV